MPNPSRIALVATIALLVSGPLAAAEPREVTLSERRLDVRMSDGAFCTAHRPGAVAEDGAGWRARLAGCPHPLEAVVTFEPRPNPLRAAFEELFEALGAPELLVPMARIVLTDARGRAFVFDSPPPDPFPR